MTACPAREVTSTVPLYTTICPVEAQASSSPSKPQNEVSASSPLSVVVVAQTISVVPLPTKPSEVNPVETPVRTAPGVVINPGNGGVPSGSGVKPAASATAKPFTGAAARRGGEMSAIAVVGVMVIGILAL